MPASPLKWSTYVKPDVAQVYGYGNGAVKRKPGDFNEQSLNECLSTLPECPSKKLCRWPQQVQQMDQATSLNHNSAESMMDDSQSPSQQDVTAAQLQSNNPQLFTNMVPSQEPSLTAFQQPMVESQQQPTMVEESQQLAMDNMDFQSGMVMNINSDDTEVDNYASAYDAMDGEGAVDFNQYGSRVANQHEQHCFGPEKSPNSGATRCYCRPTWETVSCTQAFFSDIY